MLKSDLLEGTHTYMATAFSGGSGGIDTPRAPVTSSSLTSYPKIMTLSPQTIITLREMGGAGGG